MKDLLYNLDSVASSYGENALPSIIQIDERINDIVSFFKSDHFNDFEKTETADRLQKLIDLNKDVRTELQKQEKKLTELKHQLTNEASIHL
ncbi:MAG: hypothetical protein DI538_13770 [Azospira oryzae]|jgi:hypothetical protein|nr:MAG: hypothetical protein DI538_13770 [Azospira oryzae]